MAPPIAKNLKRRRTAATKPVVVIVAPPPPSSPAESDNESTDDESSASESDSRGDANADSHTDTSGESIEVTKARLARALSTIKRLSFLSELMSTIDTSSQFTIEYFFGARISMPLAPNDTSSTSTVRSYNHVVTNMMPHSVSTMTKEAQVKSSRNFFERVTRKTANRAPSLLSDQAFDEISTTVTQKANAEMALRVVKKVAEATCA